ncbi:MAG: formate dehydrogenase accessory sulfurtransferase FdhD [Stellaceae bacterium]
MRRRRGVVLLTSRVSVEMVQTAAMMGAPIIIAVSVPTGARAAHRRAHVHRQGILVGMRRDPQVAERRDWKTRAPCATVGPR